MRSKPFQQPKSWQQRGYNDSFSTFMNQTGALAAAPSMYCSTAGGSNVVLNNLDSPSGATYTNALEAIKNMGDA
jgi:hypothetical protein